MRWLDDEMEQSIEAMWDKHIALVEEYNFWCRQFMSADQENSARYKLIKPICQADGGHNHGIFTF